MESRLEVYPATKSGESKMRANQSYRSVLVRRDLHGKLKALAAFNDLKIQELTSEILEKALQDEDSVKMIIRLMKI